MLPTENRPSTNQMLPDCGLPFLSVPLYCRGWFSRNFVQHAVDTAQFVYDPVGKATRCGRPSSKLWMAGQAEEPVSTIRQLAQQVSEGNDYKTVAQVLQLSPSTVRTHVNNIFLKLGINDKAMIGNLLWQMSF